VLCAFENREPAIAPKTAPIIAPSAVSSLCEPINAPAVAPIAAPANNVLFCCDPAYDALTNDINAHPASMIFKHIFFIINLLRSVLLNDVGQSKELSILNNVKNASYTGEISRQGDFKQRVGTYLDLTF
jgi:hypothetical protein